MHSKATNQRLLTDTTLYINRLPHGARHTITYINVKSMIKQGSYRILESMSQSMYTFQVILYICIVLQMDSL